MGYEEETTVVKEQPGSGSVVRSRITEDLPGPGGRFAFVYYILNVLEALLIIRFLLKVLSANSSAGFTSGIYAITDPFVAPFRGIFPTSAAQGSVVEWNAIIAMIVYALIAYAIVQLLRITTTRRHVA